MKQSLRNPGYGPWAKIETYLFESETKRSFDKCNVSN